MELLDHTLEAQRPSPRLMAALEARIQKDFVPRWNDLWQGRFAVQGARPGPNSVRLDGNDYLSVSGHPDIVRAQVEALATGLREVLLRHANLVPALSTAPLQGPNAVRGTALGLLALVGDGHPPEVAVAGYLALLDYVLGSVLFDSARAGRPGDGGTNPGRLPAAPPELVEAVQQSLPDLGSGAAFAFGLRTFLDGLARR